MVSFSVLKERISVDMTGTSVTSAISSQMSTARSLWRSRTNLCHWRVLTTSSAELSLWVYWLSVTDSWRCTLSLLIASEQTKPYRNCRKLWGLADSDICACDATQTMSHIVKSCPVTKLDGLQTCQVSRISR